MRSVRDSIREDRKQRDCDVLNGNTTIEKLLKELDEMSPSGFALGLHIHVTAPRVLIQTYDKEWMEYYAEHRMLLTDPTVFWAMTNSGTRRWSDLADLDTGGVLKAAAEHGLVHGILISVGDAKSRSLLNTARADRPQTDEEIRHFEEILETLHHRTSDDAYLTERDKEVLEDFLTD